MISRRRFLEVSSLTAGLAATPHALMADGAEKDDSSLPPSIAQLKSRKSEAKPITREERTERQQRARRLMTENGLEGILLMEGTSLRYFTGVRWWGGERTFALVLPAKGAAFYVCPAFEEGRAREQLTNAPDGEQADVRVWQEDESPYRRIAQGVKERGIASGILRKGAHHIKLSAADQKENRNKRRIRSHIERIFAHLKKWQDYRRVRYLGLVKNQLELTLKAVAYNLKRMARIMELESA